jgi:hypothetical protein
MISVGVAEAGAVTLYAAPMGAFLAVRASRGTSLTSLGLDVPFFVAVDLLGVVMLACLMPLEVAALISRPAWLVACAGWALRNRRLGREPPRVPVDLRLPTLATVLASAALAVVISTTLSRHYIIWDRRWHSPQVCAIGTQSIPFVNVYEPKAPWRYHYAADVLASVFRTLSFDTMSSNRALSLVHDVSFGLTAASLALLMLGLGHRPGPVPALGGVSILLHGPIPLHGSRLIAPMFGFMYSNFLSNSFRPHVGLAGLLLVGFVGAVAVNPLSRSGRSDRRVALRLAAIAGLMSLTDETSLVVLDVALGLAWLVHPEILAVGRRRGVVALLAVGAASVLPSVVLGGSFAPGRAVQNVRWVAAQVPSFDGQVLEWPSALARKALMCDLLPLLVGCIGIVLVVAKRLSRPLAAVGLFAVAVPSVCSLMATHLQVNGQSAGEVQRFFVAPFFAVFVVALLLLPHAARGSAGDVLLIGAVAAPAIFSLVWLLVVIPERFGHEKVGADRFLEEAYAIDCRRETGASLGDRPVPTYVQPSEYFLYTTCRAIFSTGRPDPPWPMKILPEYDADAQLRALDAELWPRKADGTAVCRADGRDATDAVCHLLLAHSSSCREAGTRYLQCALTPSDRDVLLGRAAPRTDM